MALYETSGWRMVARGSWIVASAVRLDGNDRARRRAGRRGRREARELEERLEVASVRDEVRVGVGVLANVVVARREAETGGRVVHGVDRRVRRVGVDDVRKSALVPRAGGAGG